MGFVTKVDFTRQVKQYTGTTATLSGSTNILGSLDVDGGIFSGGTNLLDIFGGGSGTNTFVTGGTLSGTYQLTLGRNNGTNADPIDLSPLSDEVIVKYATGYTEMIQAFDDFNNDGVGGIIKLGANITLTGDTTLDFGTGIELWGGNNLMDCGSFVITVGGNRSTFRNLNFQGNVTFGAGDPNTDGQKIIDISASTMSNIRFMECTFNDVVGGITPASSGDTTYPIVISDTQNYFRMYMSHIGIGTRSASSTKPYGSFLIKYNATGKDGATLVFEDWHNRSPEPRTESSRFQTAKDSMVIKIDGVSTPSVQSQFVYDGTATLDNDSTMTLDLFPSSWSPVTKENAVNPTVSSTFGNPGDILITGSTAYLKVGVIGSNTDWIEIGAADANTFTTGFTYNDANTFTIERNDAVNLTASIDTVTGLTTTGYIDYTTTSNPTSVSGRTFYDRNENALSYYPETPASDVTINIGQESVVRIHNNTGVQINNGQACHITSTQPSVNGVPSVVLAVATGDTSNTVFEVSGIATHDIPDGTEGFITAFGVVRDLSITGVTEGTEIFLSDTTPGGFIYDLPSDPDSRITQIGWVISTGATDAKILVELENEVGINDLSAKRLSIIAENNSSTGLREGGEMSINSGDNTLFDVTAGTGVIVDNFTDPESPVITSVTWDNLTGLTVTNLTGESGSYIFLDSNLNTVQYGISNPPTTAIYRDNIYLGILGHANFTNLINVFNAPIPIVSPINQIKDIADAIGPFSVSGNRVSGISGTLELEKSSGRSFTYGGNFHTDTKIPSVITSSLLSGSTLVYATGAAVLGPTSTDIDPDNYDPNGAGSITPIPGGNRYVAHRIWHNAQQNLLVFQYGQYDYSNESGAKEGFPLEDYVVPPGLPEVAYLVAVIIAQDGETDLDNSLIIPQGKFASAGGGGGGSVDTLQTAYNNSSDPEILTDATRGAVDFRVGSGSDSDNVVTFQQNSGTINAFVQGTGDAKFESLSGDSVTLLSTPTLNNNATEVLVRNSSSGIVEYKNSSTFNFTGNTSGTCISDLYVSNLHSCSPLNVNPLDEGNVYFGSTSGVTIDLSNVRLGINNDTPTTTLDVGGNIRLGNGVDDATITFRPDAGGAPTFKYDNNVGFLFNSQSNEDFRIAEGGNTPYATFDGTNSRLGLRTTTPSGTLHVVGVGTGSSTTALIVEDSTNSELLKLSNDGVLRINDAFSLPTTDGAVNQVLQTNGSGSVTWATAGGGGATELDGLTDCLTQDSTSAGRFSIWIANGTTAGGAAQTGTLSDARGNLCIGASAGKSITSADYCVLLGQEAGDAVTTGGQNTVMGGFALSSVSTGSQNTAIGYAALQQASTAVIKNTAIGAFSMQGAAVTGAENAAVGYGSLQNCAAGQKNAAFGALSLYSLDSGITNAVIGYRAGYANTSGSQNLYLGAYAAGVNTGSYQMSLGYNVATTQNSSLALGRSGQILLHGDYATAGQTKLGINLGNTFTAPTATLHVKGQGTTNATTNFLIENSGGNQIMKLTDSGDNIGIGYQALDDITVGSGTDNVAIGYQAGTAVTTGDFNVLLGYQAGLGFTTNGRNICIGYRAGATAAVNDLIAIGYRAGETTTGSANTFIGRDAGKDNDAESNNVYMGYHAGRNLNARENVAIGAYALEGNGSNLAAWRSIAIGYQALTDITTGDNNVAVGLNAGDSISTGSNNTFIGDAADGSATADNQIGIGAGVTVSGANTIDLGNASITTANIPVAWTVTSDSRTKKDITTCDLGLDFINALSPKKYKREHPADYPDAIKENRYKSGGSHYDMNTSTSIYDSYDPYDSPAFEYGLVAQDVKSIMDGNSSFNGFSGWKQEPNGKQGLQYQTFIPPIIKAIQELDDKVDTIDGGGSNTDNQTLSLVGTDLSITGGNTISLSSLMDDTDTNSYLTGATMNGNTLELGRNGGLGNVSVDLSQFMDDTDTNTYMTTASFSSSNDTITFGGSGFFSPVSVDISGVKQWGENGNDIYYPIEGDGNVGIGINSDFDARLTIKGEGGSSTTTSLLVTDNSDNTLFKVRDDGHIGHGSDPHSSHAFQTKFAKDGFVSHTIRNINDTDYARSGMSFIVKANDTNNYRGGLLHYTPVNWSGTSNNSFPASSFMNEAVTLTTTGVASKRGHVNVGTRDNGKDVRLFAGQGTTTGTLDGGNLRVTVSGTETGTNKTIIKLHDLPTTDPSIQDALWIDTTAGNVIKISGTF